MFRCSRCFAVVNVLVWSIFEVPQGMSLAGAIDVSAWSMLRCNRYVIARNFFISGRNLTYDSSKSSSWWALSCWSIKFDLWEKNSVRTHNLTIWYILPTYPSVKPTLFKSEIQFWCITLLELLQLNILSHHMSNFIHK